MKGKRGAVVKAEYEHLRVVHYRMGSGHAVTTYWDDKGTVYVKTVGDHVKVEKVTEDQFENAVLNHDLHVYGEDR